MKLRRNFSTELRAGDGDSPKITGYSTLFDVRSPNYGGIIEVTHKGFFDDVMDDDVVAMWEHDSSMPLAGVRNGTLSLDVDEKGVKYGFETNGTSYSKDLLINLRSGLVNQSSFGFIIKDEGGQSWEENEDGTITRHLIKASRWYDVSPVTHAYYPDTTVTVKSIRDQYEEFLQTRKKVLYHDFMDLTLKVMECDLGNKII